MSNTPELDQSQLFRIGPVEGFSPQIGHLVSLLRWVRWSTLNEVEGLSAADLDHLHDEQSNRIGALLAHVAAVEKMIGCRTFHGRGLDDDEKREFGVAMRLGDDGREQLRGKDLAHYVARLELVRAETLRELAERDDAWLQETTEMRNGRIANNYFRLFTSAPMS